MKTIPKGVIKIQILLDIFFLFVKISGFSFGGGYVAFPIIIESNEKFHWMSDLELSNILSLAGMSPGPIALNAAIGVGYKVAGIQGVFAAFLGIVIPCAIIVILVASFFFNVYNHPLAKNILYILRAIITGVILYASVVFALQNGIIFAEVFKSSGPIISQGLNLSVATINILEVKSIILAGAAFFLLLKTKLHPIIIIAGGAVMGVFLF